jgi:uncharacterized protein DUF4326
MRVLNKHRDGVPPGAVYVGRGSPYGNRYRIGIDGTREECIALFERDVLPTLDLAPLRGKDLVCYCAPKACHGDILLREANK